MGRLTLTLLALLRLTCGGAHGDTSYGIVVPDGASRTVRHAASELAKYLKKMTGAPVATTAGVTSARTAVFVLGDPGSDLAASLPEKWRAETNEEAYCLKSVRIDGTNYVILAGKSDPAVLYAVYEYLERYGNCGFFQDGDYVPSEAPRVTGIDYFTKPRFAFRHYRGDVCGQWGLKKFHTFHRNIYDWMQFYDWLAKRRINRSDFWPGATSLASGKAIELALGIKDDEPGERYGSGWPTAFSWPADVRTRLLQGRASYQRMLGIKSIISIGFGTVPPPYKKAHPDLKWVPNNYESAVIHPDEPKSYEISRSFLQAIVDLYGTDHLYWETPYSEAQGAKDLDEALRMKISCAQQDCKLFREVDPKATWVTDDWDFIACRSLWTGERRKKYIESFPEGMCYMADATTDMMPQYESSDFFHGLPWAIGNLHSYQGDDHFHGGLQYIIDIVNNAANDPRSVNLTGMVHLPEIHGHEIAYWELSTQLAWDPAGMTVEKFLQDYTLRRYGRASYKDLLAANKLVTEAIYSNNGRLPIYKKVGPSWDSWCPIWEDSLNNNEHGLKIQLSTIPNTVPRLVEGIRLALRQEDLQKGNQLYENDVVEWTKSYLGHAFNFSIVQAYQAFRAGNEAEMNKQSACALRTLRHIQDILSTRPDYWLRGTIDETMSVPGTNPATPKMIRQQCSGGLYAANDCYEQMYHYYRPRVEIYFSAMRERFGRGERAMLPEDKEFAPQAQRVHEQWLDGPIDVPAQAAFKGSPIDACRHALASTRDIAWGIERYSKDAGPKAPTH